MDEFTVIMGDKAEFKNRGSSGEYGIIDSIETQTTMDSIETQTTIDLIETDGKIKMRKLEKIDNHLNHEELDNSMICALERTFFSACQTAWTVIFVGMGLMMTGANDSTPEHLGAAFLLSGIVYIAASWFFHVFRMRVIQRGEPLTMEGSTLWTLGITLLLVLSICFEMYYAVLYPYLRRSKVVELE